VGFSADVDVVPGCTKSALYCACCNARTELLRSMAALSGTCICWYDSDICLGMKLMAGSLEAVLKLFSEWLDLPLSCLTKLDSGTEIGPGAEFSVMDEDELTGRRFLTGDRLVDPVPFCFLECGGATG